MPAGAAHLITRSLPGGFHLRLVAPLELRIQRMKELQGCDRDTAVRVLQETDSARRRYVQSNFERVIDDPHTYNLIINTAMIQPTTAVHLILQAMQDRVGAPVALAQPG